MEYDYILERMTAQEFQELIQALMEAEYGLACKTRNKHFFIYIILDCMHKFNSI